MTLYRVYVYTGWAKLNEATLYCCL